AEGWFDYSDAILEDQANLGTNATRMSIPKKNTLEFQWNNILIKKSPRRMNYFEDQKYLRDNFNYRKIGYFNLSQGVVLDEDLEAEEKLTRLFIDTGYSADSWNANLREYYFHQAGSHIFTTGIEKKFNQFNV